ncbi:hypothetical protein SPAR91_0121 [Streptococcus pneumoniae GA47283]|nr:hypothetical protein SPAR91_0121 [Streptococcus pneumoniae GA47283]
MVKRVKGFAIFTPFFFSAKIELKHKKKTMQTDESTGKGVTIMFKSLKMISKL